MHLVIAPPTSGIARQRMVKSGNAALGTSLARVTSWVSDASAPATIVSNALVVQGSGDVLVSAEITVELNSTADLELRRNGVKVASGSASSGGTTNTRIVSMDAPITVEDGDAIELWATRATASSASVRDGSWIEVAPA